MAPRLDQKPETVYGRHVDETILIVGNSASLNEMDLDVFDGYTTIGVNRLLRTYEPNYLMVVDGSVLRDEHQRMNAACDRVIMLLYPMMMSSKMRALYRGPWVSTGPMRSDGDPLAQRGPINICSRGNSAYEATQIAYRMGAKRILLAGVDLYWPPGKDSHFFGSGVKAGCTLYNEDAIMQDFLTLKRQFQHQGIELASISPWDTAFRKIIGYVNLD